MGAGWVVAMPVTSTFALILSKFRGIRSPTMTVLAGHCSIPPATFQEKENLISLSYIQALNEGLWAQSNIK